MSDDRERFIPRDGISRRRGIELATEMIKRAAAEWHSGRGDRGCRDNAALVTAYERGVAEGRRQSADAIWRTHDIWTRLGKLPQSYLDGVADAASLIERNTEPSPAEPVEDGTDG